MKFYCCWKNETGMHSRFKLRSSPDEKHVATALDTIESFKPRAVIAGHKNPKKDDSPRIIEETRQYIRDFDRVAETSTTARELYDKMLEFYPDRANPGSLWGSARAVKG